MAEIAEALKGSLADGDKLSVIGFDACMMAGCETAICLAPYAGYLLASQETEAGDGWDYGFLKKLTPKADAVDFGKCAIDSYKAYYEDAYVSTPGDRQPYTLSLCDLNKAPLLAEAVDELFIELRERSDTGELNDIKRVRSFSWGFGRNMTTGEYDMVDLKELAESLDAYKAAGSIESALEGCVVYSVSSEEKAHGLSIYFPHYADVSQTEKWLAELENMPLPDEWKQFMRYYCGEKQGAPFTCKQAEYTVSDGKYLISLSDDELLLFGRAKYYVLSGDRGEGMRLIFAGNDYSLDGNVVSVSYGGQVYKARSGNTSGDMPVFYLQRDSAHSYYRAFAIGAFETANEDGTVSYDMPAMRLSISGNADGNGLEVLSAYEVTDGMVTGRQRINMADMAEMFVGSPISTPTRTEDGILLPYDKWPSAIDLYSMTSLSDLGNNPPTIEIGAPDPDEELWLQIVLVDVNEDEWGTELIRLGDG